MALAATAALAACSGAALQTQPEITFVHRPRIVLAVAAVDVVDETRSAPDPEAARVDDEMSTAPRTALERWARDRLEASGGPGRARFIILDAAVTETVLPVETGLPGLVRDDQAERYDAVAEAKLAIVDDAGAEVAFARSRAERSQTVPESITLDEREAVWFSMTEELMRDFDADMEKRIREYLGAWLR